MSKSGETRMENRNEDERPPPASQSSTTDLGSCCREVLRVGGVTRTEDGLEGESAMGFQEEPGQYGPHKEHESFFSDLISKSLTYF